MKTLYLDCISGIAGDMALSALIDLGANTAYIEGNLKKLPIDPFELSIEKTLKQGIAAKTLNLSFDLDDRPNDSEHHHNHRKAADIIRMIQDSSLPLRVKQRSVDIFSLIAEAEGKIHDKNPADVHFHEVGAMDSIIDIIGVCLALENLDIEDIYASPVPTGHGKVLMAHGLFPVPAPATAELLKGIPLAKLDALGELTTPTGAGILKALAKKFGPLPACKIECIGYGAGKKDFEHPNVLRALILDTGSASSPRTESIIVLETQVDDMTGEALGYTMEQLYNAGALDVFYTPIYMKKNRPGTLITVLSDIETASSCESILLEETSTLGVRQTSWKRKILDRKSLIVDTPYGEIRIKQALSGDKVIRQTPEYDDIAKAAKLHKIPFLKLYQQISISLSELTP